MSPEPSERSTVTQLHPFEPSRLRIAKAAPAPYRALVALGKAVDFDPTLRELVNLRASILNGCAYCIDMHTKDARKAGESEQRLYAVAAWREAPFFTDRERAALALTDAMTLLGDERVSRTVWDEAAANFREDELAQLLMAITAINAWNRVAIATRMEPGTYRP
jgi:AhpD family alkylhydroperoxidase